VTLGTSDPRRAKIVPTELDRKLAADTIGRHHDEGRLSSREMEERIEQAFRARTLGELDAVVADLPRSAHIAADMVLTHGLPASAPARQRPWWHGVVLYTAVVDLALIGLFAATGGAAVWLVLAIIATTATFLLRLARSRRKALSRGGGKTLGR